MKLLHIDSSIQGEASASRALTREIVARWRAARPDTKVIYRDLAAQELPHFSFGGLTRPEALEAPANAAVLEEFLGADVVVIGAPLYNFTLPSQLKAWIDRIAVAGKTFRYTASGPQGLAGGQGSDRRRHARRCVCAGRSGGVRRVVSEIPVRLPRHQRCDVRACRGTCDLPAASRGGVERGTGGHRRPERSARPEIAAGVDCAPKTPCSTLLRHSRKVESMSGTSVATPHGSACRQRHADLRRRRRETAPRDRAAAASRPRSVPDAR